MKQLLSTVLVFTALLLNSCEKNIIIEPHPFQSQLSVECILEPGTMPKLFLGKTVGYFDTKHTSKDLFVKDAIITITNDLGIDTLVASHKFNFFHCTDEYFYLGTRKILPNQNYHLKILYNSNTYEADTETNVLPAKIDSITYIQNFSDFYGEHEGVVVTFYDLPNVKNNYRYRMDRVLDSSSTDVPNCATEPYPATELGRSIFFDSNIDGAKMEIVIEPAFKHSTGDVAQIYLQTLDEASARFFDDLDKQKSSKLNPFIEPVFITSNISGAFGIFGSCNNSDSVRFIFPE